MDINLVYDPSVASAPPAFKTALTAAADYLDSLIVDPITVNIQVGYGEVDGQLLGFNTLGAAGPTSGAQLAYRPLRADLAANANSTTANLAVASLPASDPTGGGRFYISAAQQKAWGLLPADGSGIDGVAGFSSTAAFDYDPANRAVPGTYDFIGIAEHELTHALGRIAGLQFQPNLYSPLDLFRYAAPGSVALSASQPAYFSIDGGASPLAYFATAGDLGDWADSAVQDSFDSFSASGVVNALTPIDAIELNALGFAINTGLEPWSTVTLTRSDQWLTTPVWGSTVAIDDSAGRNVIASEGNDTVSCGPGPITVVGANASTQLHVTAGSGPALVFAGPESTTVALGSGSGTIIGGSGALTVNGAVLPGGADAIFGGSGTSSIAGGQERLVFIGGSGPNRVSVGPGGVAFAGTGGSDLIANAPNALLIGQVGGDQLVARSGGDELVAGSGNETLNGLASGAPDVLFGGSGSDLVQLGRGNDIFVGAGGACTVVAGSGDAGMWVGAGADTFQFSAGSTGGSDVIVGFRPGTDHLALAGYAGATIFAHNGASAVQLSDGTQITLLGVSAKNLAALA